MAVEKLSDNDILMLLQAAELNAGSKAASIHQKQTHAALKELYERRTTEKTFGNVHQTGNVVWAVPTSPNCPKCGHLYISIPRLGMYHICADFNCPSCGKLHYESKTTPGICIWCEKQEKEKNPS